MYRVLIVDDEPWALVVTRKVFNWEQNGFEVIAETTSSKKAMDIICTQQPDVVFTDIRMPNIDGIELIKAIRQKGIDTEFIIVSGFAEFSYAQEAIRNGALDYCLKPLDPAKSDELLKKIYVHLENKRSLRNNEVLEALMSNSGQSSVLLENFLQKINKGVLFSMVVYSINQNDNIKMLKGFKYDHILSLKAGVNKYLYIVNTEENIEAVETDVEMFEKSGITSIGISSRLIEPGNVRKLVREAEIAALCPFVNGKKGLYFYKNSVQVLKPVVKRFIEGVASPKYEEIQGALAGIPELFVSQGLGMEEAGYFWNQIVGILLNHDSEQCTCMDMEFQSYSELLVRFKDFESLCGYLQEVFNQIIKFNRTVSRDYEANSSFTELVNYINANYHRELYLKDLAAKFYINQFYCCELFKKFLGKTFSEYIANLRMEKACELIKSRDLSIEKVAEMVGYNDYYYFNKVFKKYYGTTPAKYRKNHIKNQ